MTEIESVASRASTTKAQQNKRIILPMNEMDFSYRRTGEPNKVFFTPRDSSQWPVLRSLV